MIGFYFDEHMSRKVATALSQRNIPVILAVDVGMEGKSDEEHLKTATERDLVMVTFDRPFAGRTSTRDDFRGLICLDPDLRQNIGRMIEALAEFAELFEPATDSGKVYWLR